MPVHAAEAYLNKLIRSGFKVAVCEQVEDPAEAKGVADAISLDSQASLLTSNVATTLAYAKLQATTLLSSSTPLAYGSAPVPSGSSGQNYFTGRSDAFAAGLSTNPANARFDPEGMRDMRALLKGLPAQAGTSVFVSSHNQIGRAHV